MTPEERARQQIDLLLQQSGWTIQDRSRVNRLQVNLAARPGVAIREAVLKTGEADYLLFAGGKAIATIEAKPEGYTLTGVEEQSGKYGKGLLGIFPSWVVFCRNSVFPIAHATRKQYPGAMLADFAPIGAGVALLSPEVDLKSG